MKVDLKKSATQIAKLNTKVNKYEMLATKSFDVDNELVSLRSQLQVKENEIGRLNIQLRKSGGAIQEEASDLEEDAAVVVVDISETKTKTSKRPPSPDQDLKDFFGGSGGKM